MTCLSVDAYFTKNLTRYNFTWSSMNDIRFCSRAERDSSGLFEVNQAGRGRRQDRCQRIGPRRDLQPLTGQKTSAHSSSLTCHGEKLGHHRGRLCGTSPFTPRQAAQNGEKLFGPSSRRLNAPSAFRNQHGRPARVAISVFLCVAPEGRGALDKLKALCARFGRLLRDPETSTRSCGLHDARRSIRCWR